MSTIIINSTVVVIFPRSTKRAQRNKTDIVGTWRQHASRGCTDQHQALPKTHQRLDEGSTRSASACSSTPEGRSGEFSDHLPLDRLQTVFFPPQDSASRMSIVSRNNTEVINLIQYKCCAWMDKHALRGINRHIPLRPMHVLRQIVVIELLYNSCLH